MPTRVDQSIIEWVVLTNPNVRIDQSIIEFIVAPLAVDCNNPPGGSIGAFYSHQFIASGGAPPYVFSISAGSLPNGLSLNSATGIASGTPVATGTFNFTVKVTDAALATATVNCSITITGTALSIICNNPPAGNVGVFYSHFFPASGGIPPYSFVIILGSLPSGLSLNSANGAVSGVPTTAGTFPFTIQVTDSVPSTSSVACSITITGNALIKITLRGVKRRRALCGEEDVKMTDVPESGKVDRAV